MREATTEVELEQKHGDDPRGVQQANRGDEQREGKNSIDDDHPLRGACQGNGGA